MSEKFLLTKLQLNRINSGGGGCTLSRSGTVDALLPLLFLAVVGLLLVRDKRCVNKR
jgi:hypothetical protein